MQGRKRCSRGSSRRHKLGVTDAHISKLLLADGVRSSLVCGGGSVTLQQCRLSAGNTCGILGRHSGILVVDINNVKFTARGLLRDLRLTGTQPVAGYFNMI